MASSNEASTSNTQVAREMHANQPVFLTTRTPYPLPSQKFVIPTSWKRFHLSQLVNKAVGLEKAVPFDFLIKGGLNAGATGEMLAPGMTLGDWCAANGVGEEETVEIEYVESVMPPQKVGEIEADDWVSGVRNVDGYVMTASYDGRLRLFDHSKNSVMDVPVHSAPITSVSLISSSTSSNDEDKIYTVATSSHDLSACITQLTIPSSPTSSKGKSSKILASLHLHTQPISGVASNSSGTKLLTSSWDSLIGVWDTTIPSSDEVPLPDEESRDKKKRRKIENASATNGRGAETKRKAPIGVLKSHVGRVSKAAFLSGGEGGEEGKAVSAGYDSTVRIWDLEYGVCERTISASEKPFLDLTPAQSGQTLLAASTDRTVTQYDIRATSQTQSLQATVATFTHASTPSCVCVPPSSFATSSPSSTTTTVNSHQFITGAYDGIVRVWDMRNPKGAMAAFKTGEGNADSTNTGVKRTKKVLCVDWRKGLLTVGGEGGLEVWKVGEEA
ncbi:hypothetical protein CVT24_008958 [Panaeolus cyanescens]|uniref:NLE domain-containing protein n=1 Tax=Panaeolus cyanescens TaxID=181874 RepID=A0A409YAS8_9AGAR|nr:hypothetical protein CVT24_008958 [Panaeolus cyanescens]